jgi:hypothetical protein
MTLLSAYLKAILISFTFNQAVSPPIKALLEVPMNQYQTGLKCVSLIVKPNCTKIRQGHKSECPKRASLVRQFINYLTEKF